MGFVKIVLWVVGILVGIMLLGKLFSKKQNSDNVFDRGSSVVKNFKDCCTRGIKKMFGGGA